MGPTRLAVVLIAATVLPAAAADLAETKTDFLRFCSKCHGSEGRGDGPQAEALSTKPRDLTDCARMKAMPDDHLFTAIKEGGAAVGLSKDMPAWKEGMEDDDIRALVAFVRTLCKTP